MRGPITRSPKAIADAEECAVHLGSHSPELAFRFLDALERTVTLLADFPGIGRDREFQSPQYRGICSFGVEGFPNHLVFFRPLEDGIEVIRILHGARDLGEVFDRDLE